MWTVKYKIVGLFKKKKGEITKGFDFIQQSVLCSHMFGSLDLAQEHLNKEVSSPVEFLSGLSSYAFPNLFMLGWAFEALSCSFKFFKKWTVETKTGETHIWDRRNISHECCAVTWNSLPLLCLLMPLAPFNWKVSAIPALAFTDWQENLQNSQVVVHCARLFTSNSSPPTLPK